MVKNSV